MAAVAFLLEVAVYAITVMLPANKGSVILIPPTTAGNDTPVLRRWRYVHGRWTGTRVEDRSCLWAWISAEYRAGLRLLRSSGQGGKDHSSGVAVSLDFTGPRCGVSRDSSKRRNADLFGWRALLADSSLP